MFNAKIPNLRRIGRGRVYRRERRKTERPLIHETTNSTVKLKEIQTESERIKVGHLSEGKENANVCSLLREIEPESQFTEHVRGQDQGWFLSNVNFH